ncbi:MAG TPA: LamG domain-containing protein, partial [Sulfurovum sp.]|nr:LamG domain-containing protein [Sulfurovum sp.]
AEYRFDACEFEEGKVKDSWAGNDGIVSGDVKPISGEIINNAGHFLKGRVDIDGLGVDTSDGAKTSVSMWLKWDGESGSSGVMPLSWGNANRYNLFITSSHIGFNTWNGDMYGTSSDILKEIKRNNTNDSSNKYWHHVVAIFNNGDVSGCKLYIDGKEKELSKKHNNSSSQVHDLVDSTLHIGGSVDAGDGNHYYKDFIDEVKIYKGGLTDEEIRVIYDNEKAHKNADGAERDPVKCLTGKYACANPKAFDLAYTANERGDIKIIGNTIVCAKGENGECRDAVGEYNNNIYIIDIDIDSDETTHNSSSAKLEIPEDSEILWAKLYWQGALYKGTQDEKELASGVKYKVPNSDDYVAVDSADESYSHNWVYYSEDRYYYQASINITEAVKEAKGGWYTVANIYTHLGEHSKAVGRRAGTIPGGSYGGWSIVIAYKNDTMDLRNISVFDGYMGIVGDADITNSTSLKELYGCNETGMAKNIDIPLEGFLTPKRGDVNSKIIIFAGEGDANYRGDMLQLEDKNGTKHKLTNATNPQNDVFNSSISEFGVHLNDLVLNPNHSINNIGIDIDTFDTSAIMNNEQNSTVITLNTTGDGYHPSVFAFSTQVYEPELCYIEEFYLGGILYNGVAPVRPGTL